MTCVEYRARASDATRGVSVRSSAIRAIRDWRTGAFWMENVGYSALSVRIRLYVFAQRLRAICERPVLRSMLADSKRLLRFHSGEGGNAFASCCDPRPYRVERIVVSDRCRSRCFEVPGLLQASAAASKLSRFTAPPLALATRITHVFRYCEVSWMMSWKVRVTIIGRAILIPPIHPGRRDPVVTHARISRAG